MTSAAWVDRVGIALLHSLWQGSLVGLALLALLLLLRHATAQARYVISCLALVLMVLLPIGTFWIARPEVRPVGGDDRPPPSRLVTSAAAALEAAASLLPAEFPQEERPGLSVTNNATASSVQNDRPWLSSPAKTLLTLMVAAWSCGVVLLAARVLGGYLVACRLVRRRIEPLDEAWQARFQGLVARFRLAMPVEIWQSACIQAPVVIGSFRPVILVPLGIVTGLPVAQIEAILAHELAHVRRYDFLVNAVQCVFETLLFYHPCAWWISARIRAEREHCCDDLAVAACGDALVYARALSSLEERRSPARLALALSGGGSLLSRVRRIVGQRRASDVVGSWLAGSLAIVLPMAVGTAWVSGRTSHKLINDFGITETLVAEGRANNHPSSEAEEALFRDAITLTNDLADTLATVTDATTAAAAAEKIVELSRRHADVERRLRELRRSMAPETEARLADLWLGKIERSSNRLREEVSRVGKIPGAVDALRSSVLFAVIGLNRESLPPESLPPESFPSEVDFLVPAGTHHPRFGPSGNPLERMLQENGPERVVKVVVLGLPGNVYDDVYQRLRQILPNLGYFGSGAGDTATIYLAPVSDIDFFAAQIDFGEVTSIDRAKRVITVLADHARLVQIQSRAVAAVSQADTDDAADLALLGERLLRHDHSAVNDLVVLGSAAEPIALEYATHTDRRVRRDALLVLKKIGSEAAISVATHALADSDVGNRDLGWQIICRMPNKMRSRQVIDAAAAGLERDSEQAAKWLSEIGPAAESEVVPYTGHQRAEVRRQAALVLRAIGGKDSLSPLERLFDDPDVEVARSAHQAHETISARLGLPK